MKGVYRIHGGVVVVVEDRLLVMLMLDGVVSVHHSHGCILYHSPITDSAFSPTQILIQSVGFQSGLTDLRKQM